jgi:2-polyprenyl-3-methyl-5-hydroxy-6-metoxy-1,4-benzoquinol methylase
MASPDPRYTHGHAESVLRSHRWRTAENSAAYLLGELRAGMALLDVGCGPGTITTGLARAVAPGRVVAVDASEEVIEQARQSAPPGELPVAWEVGDVYGLSFADGSFDVVHAHQVLQHLPDPVSALREMARVAKPGGFVACRDADFAAMSWYPEVPALDRWREVYSAVARANGGEPDAGRHLLAWAHAAGFEDVSASASAWCFATPDERSWWSGLWADRITQTPLAQRALELGFASREELDELAAGWRRWGAHRDAWFSVPNAEVLCRPR